MVKKQKEKKKASLKECFGKTKESFGGMFEKVTDDSFKEFLKSKGGDSLDCPVCHNKGMGFPTIIVGDKERFLAPIKIDELAGRHELNPINFKYRAICKECGHELYFNASRVMKWLGLFNAENGSGND
ncbi:hypothetical protein KDV38_07625 [Providencia rettgeri]